MIAIMLASNAMPTRAFCNDTVSPLQVEETQDVSILADDATEENVFSMYDLAEDEAYDEEADLYETEENHLNLITRTEQEIREYAKTHPTKLNDKVTYEFNPSSKQPYAIGKMTDKSLVSALNFLNTLRYTAGVDYFGDLSLNYDRMESCQAAALIDAINNHANHDRHKDSKPKGMSDEMFDKCDHSIETENEVAGGTKSDVPYLNKYIISWIEDYNVIGYENWPLLGHRSSLLDRQSKTITFGAAPNDYNTSFFVSRPSRLDKYSSEYQDYIEKTQDLDTIFPCPETPIEYMNPGTPWSVSAKSDNSFMNATVTLTKIAGQNKKTWVFDQEQLDPYKAPYYYRGNGDIVFYPGDLNIKAGDAYRVKITGVTTKSYYRGRYRSSEEIVPKGDIEYTVHFFSLEKSDNSSDPVQDEEINNGSSTVTSVEFTESEISLQISDAKAADLSYTIDGEADATVTWISSDPSVATVSDGTITGISKGTADITATVTTADDPTGMSATMRVTVVPRVRSFGDTITVEGVTDLPYKNGKAVTQPALVVKCGDIVLEKNTDYTVSYKNNKKAADKESSKAPSVRIKMKGNYNGDVTIKFSIKKEGALLPEEPKKTEITKSDITMPTNITYASAGAKPEPTVIVNGELLLNGADYRLSYSNNKAIGEANVTITGKGAYTGSVTMPFTIGTGDISKCFLSMTGAYYHKTVWKAKIKVYDLNGSTLKNGTDYTYEYNLDKRPAVGSYIMVTVTGQGKYSGTLKGSYKLSKKKMPASKLSVSFKGGKSLMYNGAHTKMSPDSITVKYGGNELIRGKDYRVLMCTNDTKKGTAKVWIMGLGKYSGVRRVSYKIIKRRHSS